MCGIICYQGKSSARSVLLEGLKRLEYRGYDSSGMALFNGNRIEYCKALGKIQVLQQKVASHDWHSSCGIGHTRWATHGRPSVENSHPHRDCASSLFVVHNGIIENYRNLKKDLLHQGHQFRSETDTEVLAHLIEDCLNGDLKAAVIQAVQQIKGTYGIGVISSAHPDTIVVARRGSPLILGIGAEDLFAASDIAALVSHTKKVIYLQDDDVATLTPNGYSISSSVSTSVTRKTQIVDWDVGSAEKQGFPHFMLKEIHEQPEAVQNAIRGRLIPAEGISKLGGLEPVLDKILHMKRLIIVSCGTSFYAALLARYMIESYSDVAVEAELASEFRYRTLNLSPDTVVLAISQSGETADTLAAVREAKRQGVLVLGLVNVVGSNIARETDAGIYNHAGPEISVASTKAFMSQLTIMLLITLLLARHRKIGIEEGRNFVQELQSLPEKIQRILDGSAHIEKIAHRYANYKNFLYMGRKFNYPIALEGALKLKEISYIHAEAYAAGEIKHGPIALIDHNFPTVCLAPCDAIYGKMLSNIQEIRARGGPVIAVGTEGDTDIADQCDDLIQIPVTSEVFTPLLSVVPLQLLAYYIAQINGCDIDRPRNLAKSVTVE